MISEMFIKCKNSIKTEMVYQGKACTVSKAQPFVLKPSEYCLCSGFKFLSNSLDFCMAFVYLVHKFDSRCVSASHLHEGVGFIQDIIRRVYNGIFLLKRCMNGFGLWIIQEKPSIKNLTVQVFIMMDRKVSIRTIFSNINYPDERAFFAWCGLNLGCNDYFDLFMFLDVNLFQWFKNTIFKNSIYHLSHCYITSSLQSNLLAEQGEFMNQSYHSGISKSTIMVRLVRLLPSKQKIRNTTTGGRCDDPI